MILVHSLEKNLKNFLLIYVFESCYRHDMSKVCPRCGELKIASEFNRSSVAPDGLSSYCRRCQSEYSKNRYQNEDVRQGIKEKAKERYRREHGLKKDRKCIRCKQIKFKKEFEEGQYICRDCISKREIRKRKSRKKRLFKEARERKIKERGLLAEGDKKICPRCKKIKGASEFFRNNTSSDGLETYCKNCKRDLQKGREWKKLSPEEVKARKR